MIKPPKSHRHRKTHLSRMAKTGNRLPTAVPYESHFSTVRSRSSLTEESSGMAFGGRTSRTHHHHQISRATLSRATPRDWRYHKIPAQDSQHQIGIVPGSNVSNLIVIDSPTGTNAHSNTLSAHAANLTYCQTTTSPSHDAASTNIQTKFSLAEESSQYAYSQRHDDRTSSSPLTPPVIHQFKAQSRPNIISSIRSLPKADGISNPSTTYAVPTELSAPRDGVEDFHLPMDPNLPSLVYLDYYRGQRPDYGDPALDVFENPLWHGSIINGESHLSNTFGYSKNISLRDIYQSRNSCGQDEPSRHVNSASYPPPMPAPVW